MIYIAELLHMLVYRLMHALFHIKTVIISRDRYRPEGFSPRVDIGRGMITVLIWIKACINLVITYFNIELKRTKLTSHTHQICGYEWSISVEGSASETPTILSSLNVNIFQMTIDSDVVGLMRGLISCYQSFAPMAGYRCGTSSVYIWAKLTLLLMNMRYM